MSKNRRGGNWREQQRRLHKQERKRTASLEKQITIAKLVRDFEIPGYGGTCALRALAGSIVLERFSIEHKMVLGGLMYRAGLRPYDYLGFCDPRDNCGHYPGLFHCWLESGEDLIDFSCGDWQEISKLQSVAGVEVNPEGLPPIDWKYPPPDFIWHEREPLVSAWRKPPYGPGPGEIWYTPLAEGDRNKFDAATEENRPIVQDAVDKVFLKWKIPFIKIYRDDAELEQYLKSNRLRVIE